eukprot:1502856-Rhodomonas_salina.1
MTVGGIQLKLSPEVATPPARYHLMHSRCDARYSHVLRCHQVELALKEGRPVVASPRSSYAFVVRCGRS